MSDLHHVTLIPHPPFPQLPSTNSNYASSIIHLDLREHSDIKGEILCDISSSPICHNSSIHTLDLREQNSIKCMPLSPSSTSHSSIPPHTLDSPNSSQTEGGILIDIMQLENALYQLPTFLQEGHPYDFYFKRESYREKI